jgi:hypothetical protein
VGDFLKISFQHSGTAKHSSKNAQRDRAATKLIRTHELMKTERRISRKTGNNRKTRQVKSQPENE